MSAVISLCGQYRYRLQRGDGARLAFVMLNPSTADANVDDPTIRRCMGFARREGYAGIDVCNLFALRATNPRELVAHADPIGPDNYDHLAALGKDHRGTDIVCAWGAHPAATARVVAVMKGYLTDYGARLVCLGLTAAGAPRHPLYVRGDAPLLPWSLK
jgi:hypothetical protein